MRRGLIAVLTLLIAIPALAACGEAETVTTSAHAAASPTASARPVESAACRNQLVPFLAQLDRAAHTDVRAVRHVLKQASRISAIAATTCSQGVQRVTETALEEVGCLVALAIKEDGGKYSPGSSCPKTATTASIRLAGDIASAKTALDATR